MHDTAGQIFSIADHLQEFKFLRCLEMYAEIQDTICNGVWFIGLACNQQLNHVSHSGSHGTDFQKKMPG